MLKIIYGIRGSGKTKALLDRANEDLKGSKGDLIFVDKDNRCMLSLHHDIRYINALEYVEITKEYFLGFLCGLLSSNHDIEKIYIDGVLRLIENGELENFVQKTAQLAEKHNLEIIMTITGKKNEMPEFIKEFLMKI